QPKAPSSTGATATTSSAGSARPTPPSASPASPATTHGCEKTASTSIATVPAAAAASSTLRTRRSDAHDPDHPGAALPVAVCACALRRQSLRENCARDRYGFVPAVDSVPCVLLAARAAGGRRHCWKLLLVQATDSKE